MEPPMTEQKSDGLRLAALQIEPFYGLLWSALQDLLRDLHFKWNI